MSEQAHATTGTYLRIAAILVMVTLIEVGVFYVPAFQPVLVPTLLILSSLKFVLLVLFYMHLKFDSKFFVFLFSGPVPAAALFTTPIVLWHIPRFYEAALRHHNLHILQHLVFLATAVLMWWPILSPVPELPRLPYPAQMLYLFLLGIPMSVTGALITLSDGVLYPFYAAAPRVWNLSPLADQQIGGLLMWVPGGLVLWLAMTVVWFRWGAREERGDVEREVPLEAYTGAGASGTP